MECHGRSRAEQTLSHRVTGSVERGKEDVIERLHRESCGSE